jgi:hypothetical protein
MASMTPSGELQPPQVFARPFHTLMMEAVNFQIRNSSQL